MADHIASANGELVIWRNVKYYFNGKRKGRFFLCLCSKADTYYRFVPNDAHGFIFFRMYCAIARIFCMYAFCRCVPNPYMETSLFIHNYIRALQWHLMRFVWRGVQEHSHHIVTHCPSGKLISFAPQ